MSSTGIQPYLFFGGRCEEALEFDRGALGAEVEMVMKFKDSPEAPPPGTTFSGFSLALGVATEAEAERAFAALSAGGEVKMPLVKTFWSPKYGMLRDRFGVDWMVNVVVPMAR